MNGQWDADGRQLVEAICRVVARRGGSQPSIKSFPWWAEPHTPLDIAVEETLQGLGCLEVHGGDFNHGVVRRG